MEHTSEPKPNTNPNTQQQNIHSTKHPTDETVKQTINHFIGTCCVGDVSGAWMGVLGWVGLWLGWVGGG
jgi:hypothetical protein